jgi:hypothetical protein
MHPKPNLNTPVRRLCWLAAVVADTDDAEAPIAGGLFVFFFFEFARSARCLCAAWFTKSLSWRGAITEGTDRRVSASAKRLSEAGMRVKPPLAAVAAATRLATTPEEVVGGDDDANEDDEKEAAAARPPLLPLLAPPAPPTSLS